jgi:hypothetical protein
MKMSWLQRFPFLFLHFSRIHREWSLVSGLFNELTQVTNLDGTGGLDIFAFIDRFVYFSFPFLFYKKELHNNSAGRHFAFLIVFKHLMVYLARL